MRLGQERRPGVAQRLQPLKLDAASVNRRQTAVVAAKSRSIQMPTSLTKKGDRQFGLSSVKELRCAPGLKVLGVGRLIAIYSWRLTKGRRRSQ